MSDKQGKIGPKFYRKKQGCSLSTNKKKEHFPKKKVQQIRKVCKTGQLYDKLLSNEFYSFVRQLTLYIQLPLIF